MSTTNITAEPGSAQITMTREFAATPAQVYRAHTDADLVARWMGPDEMATDIGANEVEHAGAWQFTHTDPDGNAYGFRGVFHGTPSVEDGIIRTFEFDGAPGHVSLEKLTFEDLGDGRTRILAVSTFLEVETRDLMIESGMEVGVEDGYRKLDAVLADLS